MKVLILTEGGKNIGFGHITRCISIYQAFEEKRAVSPELIVNGDDSIKYLLENRNYQIFKWLKEKNKLVKLIKNNSVVIIDSYLAEKSLYEEISEITGEKIVMIDDYNRLEYPKGVVVNPSIYADKLNYSKKDGITYLLGKNYTILRKEFWDIPEKKINKKIRNILITFGGMDHSDLIYRITMYLENEFNFRIFTVEPKKEIFDAKKMLGLMLDADICISGGGQTTYELARIGVPTIGICFFQNQRLNLEHWQKKGFIEYVGWCNCENFLDNLAKAFGKLMSYENRLRHSKVGRACVDGQGIRRILDKLEEKMQISHRH